MAVGDNIPYSRVLGVGKGRVLLVTPSDSVKLGNVDDATDSKDAVNLGQVQKLIEEIPTGGLTLVPGDGIEIDDTDPENPIISLDIDYVIDNLDGFMHLTGAIDESADGNKTFTGNTQINYHIGDRLYSTSDISPSIGFYNHISNGNAAFNITGTGTAGDTNYLNVTGVLGGSTPILSAVGIDPNVGIIISTKGTGSYTLSNLTGSGTEMVTVSSAGVLGRAPIPGGGSGLTTVDFGTTPNSNGGSISGVTLTLEPADGTNPGGISLSAQVMGAGDKTFTNDIILLSGNDLRSTSGTEFLTLDGGGFTRLKSTGNLFLTGSTAQLTLSSSFVATGGLINFTGTDTINFIAATASKNIVFQPNVVGGATWFTNGMPVVMKSTGTLAIGAPSQRSSAPIHFESNLFDTTGVLRIFTVASVASTSVVNVTNLTTTYNGTDLQSTSQTGDFEILASGAGIVLTDTLLATRHRVVLTNGILTVSAAL